MRDTVYVLSEAADEAEVEASIEQTVAAVKTYVPRVPHQTKSPVRTYS